jgi:hypothetical protein
MRRRIRDGQALQRDEGAAGILTSRLLFFALIATGTLFAAPINYTLTQTTANDGAKGSACVPSCETFGFIFPQWYPYAFDGPPLDPGTPIRQLDDVHWTFTDGNPADQITEQVNYTGTYNAPDLAQYLGLNLFAIDVTPSDLEPSGTLGTLAITFDQHYVPFATAYNGPDTANAVIMASTDPVVMPEPSLPLEVLVLLSGVAIFAKWRRLSSTR